MKLTILLASLLFAATSAKGVYVEGATTDSSVKLGANEAPRRGLGGQSDDRRMDQTAEADVAAAKALSVAPSMAPSMAPRRSLAPSCLNAECEYSDADRLEYRCMKSCVANKATCSWYCDLMRKWHYG